MSLWELEREPRPERVIAEFEDRFGVSLPNDFRQYLTAHAPDRDFMPETGLNWWAFDRIKSISDEYERYKRPDDPTDNAVLITQGDLSVWQQRAEYLLFANEVGYSHFYAICCGDGVNRGKVAAVGGKMARHVADTFSDFANIASSDPLALSVGGRASARPTLQLSSLALKTLGALVGVAALILAAKVLV